MQIKLGDLDLGRYFSTSKAQTNSSVRYRPQARNSAAARAIIASLQVGTPFYMSPECMRSEP
jgi:serine/threonine protein kinase